MKITYSWGNFPTYKNAIKRLFISNAVILINEILSVFRLSCLHSIKKAQQEFRGTVDYISGADLFMLNTDLARFDERFFLYYEETDLQYQLNKKNLRRIIITGPQIVHFGGKSNNTKRGSIYRHISFSNQQIIISRLIFFKKNNYKKLLFFLIYFLSQMLLIHVPFFEKTVTTRKK